jgi:hypothetical protein
MTTGLNKGLTVGIKRSYLYPGLRGTVETETPLYALVIVPPQGGKPRVYVFVYENGPLPTIEERGLSRIPHREVVVQREKGDRISKIPPAARREERHLVYRNATIIQVTKAAYER